MKAVVMEAYGDPNHLKMEDVDAPAVGPGEVRVRVHATSVNPIDWKIRSGATRGRIDVELPAILGRDLAGEVESVGEGVTGFSIGQRVMALANGTYAEYTTAKANVLAPIPENLDFKQAAALPLVVTTGAQLMERAIKIQPGQKVLVLGALGGVGRTAVHVALDHGATVLAGVRRSEMEEAKSLGAQQIVAIDDERELEKLHDLDAVADTVGGPTAERALRTLKEGGVFGTTLGVPKGATARNIRAAGFMAQPDASRLYELADDAARGSFRIPIAKTLPLDQAREAHREAENGHTHGKIILLAAA
ncbi:MAG: NADP-dependent oxidoreductase [Acidobacteriaceae bacterium]